jgi:hypothetical protein
MKKKIVKNIPVYYIFPILLIVAVVPLMVHLKQIQLDETAIKYWIGDKQNSDFFSYYKAIYTIILSVIALVMFLIARSKNILETKKLIFYYIPISVYAITAVISTLFSKYPSIAQNGFVDRYEGVYVLLSYLAILFLTINLVNHERFFRIIMIGLFLSALILGTIGIFQFFGFDFFKSSLGKIFILPEAYRKLKLEFTFGAHTIYTTLYNTNYVGSYMAMLLPLALAAFVFIKKANMKIITGLLSCLMFANWIGCKSRTGYLGGVIAVVFLILLMRKLILKDMKTIIPLLVCFALIFVVMDYSAGGALGGQIINTLSKIEGSSAVDEEGNKVQSANTTLLKDIKLSGKQASVVYGEDTLNMVYDDTQLQFSDTDGKQLTIKNSDSGVITLEDQRYSAYSIQQAGTPTALYITLESMKFVLQMDQDGFKILGEGNVAVDTIDHPETFGFKGNERFASSRGYIWSRSIPLLKNNIIFGGGPDTYAAQFPQHDYVGKLIAFDKTNEIVDKPHNMYLQMGINTGVLSLIAFIFMLGVYFISSIRTYYKIEVWDERKYYGVALFTAVLGYAAAGLANDSLLSVAPVFWVILGMGISCNYLNTKVETVTAANNIKQQKAMSQKKGRK